MAQSMDEAHFFTQNFINPAILGSVNFKFVRPQYFLSQFGAFFIYFVNSDREIVLELSKIAQKTTEYYTTGVSIYFNLFHTPAIIKLINDRLGSEGFAQTKAEFQGILRKFKLKLPEVNRDFNEIVEFLDPKEQLEMAQNKLKEFLEMTKQLALDIQTKRDQLVQELNPESLEHTQEFANEPTPQRTSEAEYFKTSANQAPPAPPKKPLLALTYYGKTNDEIENSEKQVRTLQQMARSEREKEHLPAGCNFTQPIQHPRPAFKGTSRNLLK